MGAVNNGVVETAEIVQKIRALMSKQNVDAYIIPSEDEHASEYPAVSDLLRGYATGFNGSAGCALITQNDALLFTDGRYFLQASQQLQPGVWTLMRMGEPGMLSWQEWLVQRLAPNARVGVDPKLISAEDARQLAADLRASNSSLVPLTENFVALVWPDRPSRAAEPITTLPDSITGCAFGDKIAALRREVEEKRAYGFVATMLDEVAWLFNLRGTDVPYNPVFFAFSIVTLDTVWLYVNASQLTDRVRAHLGSDVVVRPYDAFYTDLRAMESHLRSDQRLLIGKRASLAVLDALGAARALVVRSIVVDQKSIKNAVELDGFREAHLRDGAALVRYFAWLQDALHSGETVTETQGANKLTTFREAQPGFQGLSFTTISSTGPNGAIIHYAPPDEGSPAIDPNTLYLCDSGAHFSFGTTDVTRTLHFGAPTAEQKRCFTRVLQGHIAIDRLIFPNNTTGYVIDALARAPGWQDHLEYRHGTGHGVGHFLNVHEPPMGIGTRAVFNETGLKSGMVISNEPGYYLDGQWGIRIENLLIVTPHELQGEAEPPTSKGFLRFEHITLCPIQTSLMEPTLMTVAEREWMNAYHDEVYQKLKPLLEEQGDARALKWLEKECAVRV
ncbi:Xaa-Pro aminopeptidase [Malassezia vespertilionis]|uniref:Fra1p n=1 Tax=Malassezia vespertilionis TaxID=2020962 RepID=A0A2N1JEU1_9BASI|nr:Xaa-Pro aminopeptidase [Malassezia vespertilionis]PKI85062.1 hypothetical protein MVES_001008 [Malassezia vespertilionis]WFD05735.1 Xaa-Pro aminopeptidase [Malassezia vespertilionis]